MFGLQFSIANRSRLGLLGLLICLACGKDSTAPDPLNGTYNAVSVNGFPLPATYTVGVIQETVYHRRLMLLNGLGSWDDSTVVVTSGTKYNASQGEFIKWTVSGNRLTVLGSSPSSQLALFFIVQPDGSLLSDFNDGMSIVYRR